MSNSFTDILRNVKSLKKDDEVVNIMEFIQSPWGLSPPGIPPFKPYPAQGVILKAHYGIPLDNKKKFKIPKTFRKEKYWDFTEKEYLEYLFNEGRSNIKEVEPGHERRKMVLSLGRRSGKTSITAVIVAYEVYKLIEKVNPHAFYGIPTSNIIQMIVVATGKEQASLLYSEASGHFRNSSFFNPYTAKNTLSYAMFQTPKDIEDFGSFDDNADARMGIRVTFKSCIAKGLRGSGNIVVVMDEAAHFADTGQASAKEVYDAVEPSTLQYSPKDPETREPMGDVESRIILISSPLGRDGHFYRMFRLGFSEPKNLLCIQAPTWEVNPTVEASALIESFKLDPQVFAIEYGASFKGGSKGWIENEQDLVDCIDENLSPQLYGIPKKPYFMGIDVALKGDATAIAIGHIENGNEIVVDLVDTIKAGEGRFEDKDRLTHDIIADWILDHCNRFMVVGGMFDQHEGFAFEDALTKRGLKQFEKINITRKRTSEIFKNFKTLIYDQKLHFYNYPVPEDDYLCDYLRELTTLISNKHSKWVITVEAPNTKEAHDDMSDALSRMIWVATQHFGDNKYLSQGKGASRSGLPPRNKYKSYRNRLRGGTHRDRHLPKKKRR